ncbi:MAG: transpeptidase family protein [Chitinophagaceae bacterium]|nr:transpeptidase family protein [Chitinophagaceae bacterium]
MKISKDIRFRVYITFLGMCIFGVIILYKASHIVLTEGKDLRAMADSMHTKIQFIQPERGNIYSEDGNLLSSSIPEFDLRVDFKSIPKDTFSRYLEPLSKNLARILGEYTWVEYKEILSREYKAESRYFLLKRRASYSQYLDIRKIQPFSKNQNKGGLITESYTKRINPYGLLANRVIGLSRSNSQNVGIERQYDSLLRGSVGQRVVRCIAGGTWMPLDGSEIDPVNGRDVMTTIDVNIQDVAENALLRQVEKENAAFGTCIVMEVKTGKIKAIANLGRLEDGSYYEDFNYALKKIEPGSTFKLMSLISLMRDHLIKVEDVVDCQGGSTKIGPFTIRDSHAGLGTLSIKDAFAHSSNVAFAKLIYQNYRENIGTYWSNLHAMGLDDPTGIGLAGDPKPHFLRDSVTKGRFSLAFMGMGYSVMITPLHTCMVYNAIANQGKLMKPYLVNSIQEYGKDVITYSPKVINPNLLDTSSIRILKDVMNEVVESGTGKALKNPYYTICGKTGTAQVADKGIRYTDRVYHGSFVGFFPKEDPQYTICVVLRTRKGSNNYYGGQIALPVFKEVANRLYAIKMKQGDSRLVKDSVIHELPVKTIKASDLNTLALYLKKLTKVPASAAWVQQVVGDSTGRMQFVPLSIQKKQVPNVTGMGLRDALYVLENAGLKVIPVGKGKVNNQSISPGTPLQKGQYITIHLS